MMRVAYIVPHLTRPCGWKTFTIGAIGALREFVKPLLFVAEEDAEAARSIFSDLPIYQLPVTQQASMSRIRGAMKLGYSYWKIQRQQYPDLQLVHSLEAYPTGLIGSWIADRYRVPHILTAHGTYALIWVNNPIDCKFYERMLVKTGCICPVSHGTANLMCSVFEDALTERKIVPVLNGNNFYRMISKEEAINRSAPISPTFLSVGEIKPRKGQFTCLQAFSIVKKHYPQAHYWMVGNYIKNDYYNKIKSWITENGLSDAILYGKVSDDELQNYYRQASVFILNPQPQSSARDLHIEGFGLVFLEAGAFGLPVIGTFMGGIPDAIQDGITGILTAPGDVDALAAAMLKLVENSELSKKMGIANRLWAETLTWERYAQEQYRVYMEVLN